MASARTAQRLAAWAGVVVCTILFASWTASLRWTIYYGFKESPDNIFIALGCVGIERPKIGGTRPGFYAEDGGGWYAPHMWSFGTGFGECMPLWIPMLPIAAGTAYLFWRSRRQRQDGRCAGCGYDLTGNVSGRCPECSTEVAAAWERLP